MSSEKENPVNVSGCLDAKDLPPNSFKPAPYLEIGKWYWIQYNTVRYDYYTEKESHHSFKEIQKCIDVWDAKDGKHGVFKTDRLGLRNIPENSCFPYRGAMKKEFIIWGADIPDI